MDERNIQNCLLKLSYLTLCLGSMRHSDSALINSAVIQWELNNLPKSQLTSDKYEQWAALARERRGSKS